MSGRTAGIDDVLRGHWDQAGHRAANLRLAAVLVGCGFLYGALMGTSSGVSGDRLLQVVFSATKVPLLLLVTFFIALPSFWVLNRLLGLGDDFPLVFRALIATQATLTLILIAISPYVLLWYVSSDDYSSYILVNATAFGVASLAAQYRLSRYYRPLIARNRRHRAMQAAWITIYAFVGIQMAWTLRPFIGNPGSPVQFFRDEPFGNAYQVVFRLIAGAF